MLSVEQNCWSLFGSLPKPEILASFDNEKTTCRLGPSPGSSDQQESQPQGGGEVEQARPPVAGGSQRCAMKSKNDPETAAELRRIQRQHPDWAARPDARPIMTRLAILRCRFHEMNAAVREAGGSKEATAAMTAELRQLSRACSALEQQLSKPTFEPAGQQNEMSLMLAVRNRLVAAAKAREAAKAINGEATAVPAEPFSVAALLQKDGSR